MISAPVPTRAEVSDVATAIFEGADAVMLSAELAAGQFPVQAVATMNRIAEEVEGDPLYRNIIAAQRAEPEATGADAIADAARHIADTLDLAAVICWTSSGSTGLRVARERPRAPIVALSPNIATGRRLAVAWGVHCVVTEDAHDQDDMVDRACRIAFKEGFAKSRPTRDCRLPACRSARLARPTCCASPMSARMRPRTNLQLRQPSNQIRCPCPRPFPAGSSRDREYAPFAGKG